MDIIVQIIPTIILIYLVIGFAYGIYFYMRGVAQLDELIKESKWAILVSGTIRLWPLLLLKLKRPLKASI